MNQNHIDQMELIFGRINMYVTEDSEKAIVNFIHGLEVGLNNEVWTDQISKLLEEKYKIAKPAMCWPYQIKVHAEKKSNSWADSFKTLVREVISNNHS